MKAGTKYIPDLEKSLHTNIQSALLKSIFFVERYNKKS